MKSFRVEVWDFPPCITRAETSSKARYQALLSVREAGYEDVRFSDIQVRRAKEYDNLTWGDRPRFWIEDQEKTK